MSRFDWNTVANELARIANRERNACRGRLRLVATTAVAALVPAPLLAQAILPQPEMPGSEFAGRIAADATSYWPNRRRHPQVRPMSS